MHVIIAGGRKFNDYYTLSSYCDLVLKNQNNIHIISGNAKGADRLGERYAKDHGYPLLTFPADWDAHGKAAGYIRNTQMAEHAEGLIAFWDGVSKGTKHMIDIAKKSKLKIRVKRYK